MDPWYVLGLVLVVAMHAFDLGYWFGSRVAKRGGREAETVAAMARRLARGAK